jgi:hypothetical protein
LDYGTLRTDDFIAPVDQQWSALKLAYSVGANVTLGAGASATSLPTYFFDGYRIEVDSKILAPAAANPLLLPLATVPGRVWVYLSTANVSDPLQPFAEIRIESVAAATVESPGANELALVGVDIDAGGVVTGNTYPASEPANELAFGTIAQRWTRGVEFDDTADFDGAVTFDSSADFNGVTTVNTTLFAASGALIGINASNSSAVNPTLLSVNAAGPSAIFTGVSASYGIVVSNTGSGPSIQAVKTVAGVALFADATAGGGTAIQADGGAIGLDVDSSAGLAIDATTDTGTAVQATASGSGAAIVATGGPSAASRAGTFISTHTGATALRGSTAAAALSTAVAVQGTANGDSVAVQGTSGDGYAIVASGDTTSPKRSAMRWVPQDADPTTPMQGDVLFNSSRIGTTLGRIRVYTSLWESVHASPKGLVSTFSGAASGGPIAGGSGNLSLVSITPEQVGDVLVTMTGSFEFSVDTGQCTLYLYDALSGVIVAQQVERAADLDGAGVNTRSVVIRGVRTLPSTAARGFYASFIVSVGTVTYTNVIVTVTGVK